MTSVLARSDPTTTISYRSGLSRTGTVTSRSSFSDSDLIQLHWAAILVSFSSLARIHRRTPMDGVRTAEGGG